MIPVGSVASTALTWTRLPHHRGFEIHHGNEVISTLHIPDPGSSNFLAESGDRKWIFRRSGFLGASAEIFEEGTQCPIAIFKPGWRMQGVLIFTDGQAFHLECKGVWHPVWNITDENREPVLSLHSREEIIETQATSSVSQERLLLLSTFALYRILQAEEDAASAAIVAVLS